MVQLYPIGTELGGVSFKRFVLLKSASMELVKDYLPADIRSSGVQAGFQWSIYFERGSHSLHDTQYFGGIEQSDLRCSFSHLSLPIIIVVIRIEIKRLGFMVSCGDDYRCSEG
jgi:hypothetical protein